MSLQQIVIVFLGVAAVGGGVWYVMQPDSGSDATTQIDPLSRELESEPAEEAAAESTLAGSGSFAELFRRGQSLECTYTYSDIDGVSGTGVGYFAEGKMRIDADTIYDGAEYESHVINDGTTLYTWTETPEGMFAMKMAAPEDHADSPYDENIPEQQRAVSMDQEVTYDCDPWRTDASVFVPPSNVEFMDFEAQMQELMQGLPEGFEMPAGLPGQ